MNAPQPQVSATAADELTEHRKRAEALTTNIAALESGVRELQHVIALHDEAVNTLAGLKRERLAAMGAAGGTDEAMLAAGRPFNDRIASAAQQVELHAVRADAARAEVTRLNAALAILHADQREVTNRCAVAEHAVLIEQMHAEIRHNEKLLREVRAGEAAALRFGHEADQLSDAYECRNGGRPSAMAPVTAGLRQLFARKSSHADLIG